MRLFRVADGVWKRCEDHEIEMQWSWKFSLEDQKTLLEALLVEQVDFYCSAAAEEEVALYQSPCDSSDPLRGVLWGLEGDLSCDEQQLREEEDFSHPVALLVGVAHQCPSSDLWTRVYRMSERDEELNGVDIPHRPPSWEEEEHLKVFRVTHHPWEHRLR